MVGSFREGIIGVGVILGGNFPGGNYPVGIIRVAVFRLAIFLVPKIEPLIYFDVRLIYLHHQIQEPKI